MEDPFPQRALKYRSESLLTKQQQSLSLLLPGSHNQLATSQEDPIGKAPLKGDSYRAKVKTAQAKTMISSQIDFSSKARQVSLE